MRKFSEACLAAIAKVEAANEASKVAEKALDKFLSKEIGYAKLTKDPVDALYDLASRWPKCFSRHFIYQEAYKAGHKGRATKTRYFTAIVHRPSDNPGAEDLMLIRVEAIGAVDAARKALVKAKAKDCRVRLMLTKTNLDYEIYFLFEDNVKDIKCRAQQRRKRSN
jgi:hypothetical protein